jgi:hypothetical protein
MAVSSNRNGIMLHLLPHFKALALSLSLLFQHRPQYFAHTSAIWKTQIQHLSMKVKRAAAKYLEFVVAVHQVFLALMCRLPVWPNSNKRNLVD